MSHGGWILATLLAFGCGSERLATEATGSPDNGFPRGSSNSGRTISAHDGAVVNVELRGQDQLTFPNGARIFIERFVVNFGSVSLVRDLANPSGTDVDVPGAAVPVVGVGAENSMGNFVIGREKFEGGAFEGLGVQLSPPTVPATGEASASTLFVRGRFIMPSNPSKRSESMISPNPAPISPGTGQSGQGLSSSIGVTFTFQSRLSERLLLGLGNSLNLGDSVTLVFAALNWFTDDVVAYLSAEASSRLRLGVADLSPVVLGGVGVTTDSAAIAIGEQLEHNIFGSIGFERR